MKYLLEGQKGWAIILAKSNEDGTETHVPLFVDEENDLTKESAGELAMKAYTLLQERLEYKNNN